MTRKVGPFDAATSYALLTVLGALLAAPLLFMVSMALASDATTTQGRFSLIPREFEVGNFARIFDSGYNIGRFLLNSCIIALVAVVGQVLSSSIVAYGFARLRAPGKNALFLVLLSTMMIPGEVTLIPQFVIYRELGWLDTMLPLLVPHFFGGAYNIFLMRQFITRIPRELDEAAQVDGMGFMGIYVKIVLPLMTPVLVAVGVFVFSFAWGWFIGPLIYLNSEDKMPLALGVHLLSATSSAGQAPPWNMVMVGSLLLTVPMILVYFFSQRYIYELSLTAGSAGIR
jgi:multiple sugar transport system permease protein